MIHEHGEEKQRDSETERGILLVEDEELLRTLMEDYLGERGFRVFSARDGAEAVHLYRENWNTIQIVFSDVDLPMLNGLDAFQRMKEINPDVRVIFASGSLNPSLKHQLRQAGAKRFVQKPYGLDDILKTIREVLQEE